MSIAIPEAMMAKKNSKKSISDIFKKINNTLDKAIDAKTLRPLARFTIDLIVKRTRLGYGVDKQFGTKQKLKPLSPSYIQYRKDLASDKRKSRKKSKILSSFKTFKLSDLTTASRSNLTLTSQMLGSMQILSEEKGKIFIGPLGQRDDGETNERVADYQAKQGRIFNRVSMLEFNQIVREYRRTFGDLLKKEKLLR